MPPSPPSLTISARGLMNSRSRDDRGVIWRLVGDGAEDGAPEGARPDVATGRLFRSLHADGASAPEALAALDLDDVVRLRSVSLAEHRDPVPGPTIDPDFAHLFAEPVDTHMPDEDLAEVGVHEEMIAGQVEYEDDGIDAEDDDLDPQLPLEDRSTPRATRRSEYAGRLDAGVPAWTAAAMIVGVSLLIGIADVFVTGQLGWLTGIALVVVSAYAAATVRPSDGYWVVVTPALAFLLTTITIGQATVTGGGFWVRQGLLIPFTLGRAALWIVSATALAAVIVGVRRRRALTR